MEESPIACEYDGDVAYLASRSKTQHLQIFSVAGDCLGDTLLLTNLGMKMFPCHPSEFFR